MLDEIKGCLDKSISKFNRRVMPLAVIEHGILTSEAFAFCAVCDYMGVNLVLESGFGRSTLAWACYFSKKTLIRTVDERKDVPDFLTGPKFSNVKFYQGDSRVILPELVAECSSMRIGVFIDGPKRMKAIHLAEKLFGFENVCLIGMHDLQVREVNSHKIARGIKKNEARRAFKHWNVSKILTDDLWFVEKYCYLDSDIIESPGKHWTPYKCVECHGDGMMNMGSYGFTVGIVYKPETLS